MLGIIRDSRDLYKLPYVQHSGLICPGILPQRQPLIDAIRMDFRHANSVNF